MADFIYTITVPHLLDIKRDDPEKALAIFRDNQHALLKKYGYKPTHKYYIDFDGNIQPSFISPANMSI